MENNFLKFENDLKKIYSWNLTYSQKARSIYPKNIEELKNIIFLLKKEKKKFAIKTGECSYDSKSLASESSKIIISLKNFNQIKEVNLEKNFIVVESGVKISQIIERIFHKNISLYAVPGGENVTIGGAIAGNVFGKDSTNLNSSFGDSVFSIKTITYDGEIQILNRQNKDFFDYVGSFGFFGIILEAKIRIKKTPSPNLEMNCKIFNNINDILKELDSNNSDYKYVQIDPFFRKENFGIAFKAKYIENNENLFKKKYLKSNFLDKFFFKVSSFLVNKITWKIFYSLFFLIHKNKKQIMNIHNFHYASKYKHMIPLICRGGLKEYEIIGKLKFNLIFDEIKNFIKLNNILPIYIIMKKHFKSKQEYFYSFNDNGYSISFAFNKKNFNSEKIIRFKDIVEKYNLKVNLTKTDDFKLNLKSLSKNSIFMSRYKEIMMENKK